MSRPILFTVASALFILNPQSLVLGQDRDDRLTTDLYMEWERVSDPRISPDGTQIIYTRQWVDKMHDRWQSALWIMEADGSRNRFLTDGSSARWSPDGTRILFLKEGEPEGRQIFVRWMDAEGATSQITRVDHSPGNVVWSPDGQHMAFTMLVPERESWPIDLPSRPEGAEWTAAPKIVTRLQYRRDRQGYTDNGYRQIFVVPATGGTPRQLTNGDWNHGAPAWTPDGREILFSSLRVPDAEYEWRESEIYAVDVASKTFRTLTSRHGPDGNPTVSPDGRLVAYTGYDWSDDTYTDSRLYIVGIDGSNARVMSGSLDRSPQRLIWAPDNSGVYFSVNDRGTTNLYFSSTSGDTRQVTEGNHRLSVSTIASGRTAVGVRSSYHEPGDVVSLDLRQPDPIELTHVNDDVLEGITLGEVEEVWYTSLDDYQIQGWIIKPPDFDPSQEYPLILAIHGGPHGMYGVGFNFGWQNHAANGYVVLYTNPRGSSGYGSAFGNAIKRAYPGKDFDDLMAGVDTVLNRGYIDEQNMFVYGGSGGGVLTAWIVGHTDRFAAASSNYPVIDWISFVGTTDGASWYRNFDHLPWEDPSEHLQRSPLMYVGNVTTPTMLMTGEDDLRTPISQTEEFYQALKFRKVPTAMIRFNNEWHGTSSKPSNAMRSLLYLRSWFQQHARDGEGRPVSSNM
jgi:dipeptidyl aminopeptidase/acylaminoacyl peptidase